MDKCFDRSFYRHFFFAGALNETENSVVTGRMSVVFGDAGTAATIDIAAGLRYRPRRGSVLIFNS